MHTLTVQGLPYRDERMQVAKRAHRGEDDFATHCFRISRRCCMRYCQPDGPGYRWRIADELSTLCLLYLHVLITLQRVHLLNQCEGLHGLSGYRVIV